MFRILAAASAAIVAAFAAFAALAQQPAAETYPLTIETTAGPRNFVVEFADEPDERARGLMFRRAMDEDAGMLFDFGDDVSVSMWMKNTYLPLDMLFIEKDGTVLSIARRTTPLSERTIRSGGRVRYVLEINGGRARALGIAEGDVVSSPAMSAQ